MEEDKTTIKSSSESRHSDTYRRLIKSHNDNSNKNKTIKGIEVVQQDSDTGDLEYDSSSDNNPNTFSLTSELLMIKNRILNESSNDPVKEMEYDPLNKPPGEFEENSPTIKSNLDTVKKWMKEKYQSIISLEHQKMDIGHWDTPKASSPIDLSNTAEFGKLDYSISSKNLNTSKLSKESKDVTKKQNKKSFAISDVPTSKFNDSNISSFWEKYISNLRQKVQEEDIIDFDIATPTRVDHDEK